jgi:hypothetical protein
MLICDWCGEPIENGDIVAKLKVEFEGAGSFSRPDRAIDGWMRYHEDCGTRVIYAAAEAIEDIPDKQRPEPTDDKILHHIPVLRSGWPDGPAGGQLHLDHYLGYHGRPMDAMRRADLESLLDLSFRTRDEIASLPGVGATTLKQLEVALHKHGLSFAGEKIAEVA